MPLPRIPRFQKQRVFNLSGCGLDAPAALGGEDHQLRGMLPRTALLDMLGLLEDERSLATTLLIPMRLMPDDAASALYSHCDKGPASPGSPARRRSVPPSA